MQRPNPKLPENLTFEDFIEECEYFPEREFEDEGAIDESGEDIYEQLERASYDEEEDYG